MAPRFLIPIKSLGSAPPLFFVPSAGTTVLSLVQLARSLESTHPLHAFELSALPSGEGRPTTIAQIASLCVKEIGLTQETGPYFIGGHCWGGIVAFEIAARLEATGKSVASLTLMEALPPPFGSDAIEDDVLPPAFAKALSDLYGQVRESVSRLPPEVAEQFGPLSSELLNLALRYHATTRINAPVFLIRTPTHPKSVFQGWSYLTSGHFEEDIVPGDAFSMLAAPAVKVLSTRLDEVLRNHGERFSSTRGNIQSAG